MRLFVAVWPPPAVVERLAALDRPVVAGLRWTGAEQWHVTLRFLGAVPDGEVDDVRAALRTVVPVVAPVKAVVGPAVGRFGSQVVHAPVAGLDSLARAVVAATTRFGQPPDTRPFHGHITVARARDRGRDLRAVTGAAIEGEWTVPEFTLVESRLSSAGATYTVVGAFPLVG